ncbi:MAG: glutamate-5-semialdehyde dehydrogenase [Planctomycetota bacterium]
MEENPLAPIARRSRAAAWRLAAAATEDKDRTLAAVRDALVRRREEIARANRADKQEAEALTRAGKLSAALGKRLDLEGPKFDAAIAQVDGVIRLPDPVGRVQYAMRLDGGLELFRVTCPIGVLGVIFEARPDAAIQISALGLKSSNAVILKGGREAERTNRAIVEAIREGLRASGTLPEDAVELISTREEVRRLLELDELVDLVIPRGSNELVRSIQASTRIPVLGHAEGLCAVYVDRAADREKAIAVVLDAKTQYPAVCNAAETLLVHRVALETILPELGARLRDAGVELRADRESRRVLPWAKPAQDADYWTEFLDLVMAVKCVESLEEAVEHINVHGSHHTDAIVTEDRGAAEYFLSRVDSAGVFWNASTRFADGYRYGLGAEVGISTQKTHARGPVGLEGLVIYKYLLYGDGHCVGAYGPGKKSYLHAPLSEEEAAARLRGGRASDR